MRYAETGVNLEVDLTRGNIERVQTDPKDTELYLGGLGTATKILWDRVPPEVEPFSPENLLIFSAGLLCGTPATFYAAHLLPVVIVPLFLPFLLRRNSGHFP
jgi:benzoyl-CoA reductase subunit BamB